jgi:DNA-binding transcriptional LysR family regulator
LNGNAFLHFSSWNNMQDRLDALTIFAAVAERQSFAEAARQLSRSPASVTRAVAALEARLQTRLFNRTTRSVALTDAGTRYLEACRRLLGAYDQLEVVNLGDRVESRGWISVTALTMFGRLHVLPLVHSFLSEHPQVNVRLLLLDRVVSLVDEGLDLGVLNRSAARLRFAVGQSGAGTTGGLCKPAIHCSPRGASHAARHREP